MSAGRPIVERRVISLAGSPRTATFMSQPSAAGFRVFDAFDGRTGAGRERIDFEGFEARNERAPKGGEIGCVISHADLLREFADAPGAPTDAMLIAEDDAVLTPESLEIIDRVCRRVEFDLVHLSNPFEGAGRSPWVSPVRDWMQLSLSARWVGGFPAPWRYRVGRTQGRLLGTGLYLVTRSAAGRLADYATEVGISWCADDYDAWHRSAGLDALYAVRPNVCDWSGGSEIDAQQWHLVELARFEQLKRSGMVERLKHRFGRKSWPRRGRRLVGALRSTFAQGRSSGTAADPLAPPAPLALLLVPVGGFGGVARHVVDLVREGVPGWRLAVLCPDGALAERLRALGAEVRTDAFGPDAGLVSSLRALRSAVVELRPAIVHSHLAYADIVSALHWLPAGVRRVSTEHGIAGDDAVYHESGLKARVMAAAHALRQRRFAARIAVSEATAAAMRARWDVRQQILVIPNGVDVPVEASEPVEPPEPVEGSGPHLLSLARLAPEKRLDRLVEAFALVRAERPGATLTIAGEGELEPELRAQIAALGLDGAVRLPGFVDAEAAMAGADAIVQLSVWENCSYTLLDAAARGIPVVASPVGGNPEIVPAASLVDADDPAAVAERILAVFADPPAPIAPMPTAEMARRLGVVYDRVVGAEGGLR